MSVLTPTPPVPPAPAPATEPSPAGPPRGASIALRVGAVVTGLLIILAALNLFQLTVGREHTTARYAYPMPTVSGAVLVLEADAADVTVEPGSSGGIRVERSGSTAHGQALGDPTLDGSTLRLPGDCHGGAWGWLSFCSVSYDIQVPPGVDLTVRTGSGDVDVAGLTTSSLTVKAGSGDLSLTDLTSQSVTANAGSGDIDVADLSSPSAVVETGSGDVTVTYAVVPSDLRASTGSGDLEVYVPRDDTAYTVHQHTGSGDLSNHLLSSDRDPATGPTHVLSVQTGSGDLTLGYAG